MSFGFIKYLFMPMLFTTTSHKEGWQKKASESKPSKTMGSFSLKSVKATSPGKSEGLKSKRPYFVEKYITADQIRNTCCWEHQE